MSKKGFLFPKQIHFWLKRLYLPARNVSPEVCKSGCEPTVNLMESQLPIGRFCNRLFQDTQYQINNLSYGLWILKRRQKHFTGMYQVDILVDVLKNNYSQIFIRLRLVKYFVYSRVSNKSNGTLKNNKNSSGAVLLLVIQDLGLPVPL